MDQSINRFGSEAGWGAVGCVTGRSPRRAVMPRLTRHPSALLQSKKRRIPD